MADVVFKTYGQEVVNVTNPAYGSGPFDGSTDNRAQIQAAVDAAFGSATTPNGSSSWLNRPLYFPHGRYFVSTPIILTNVQGGYIFGDGVQVSYINGVSTVFSTNGLSRCLFERMAFAASNSCPSGIPAVELDWNGVNTGTVMAGADLTSNVFRNVNFGNPAEGGISVRIGNSNASGSTPNNGTDNHFDSCYFSGDADNRTLVEGLVIASRTARGNKVTECNLAHNSKAIHVINGSVTLVSGGAFQSGGIVSGRFDVVIDSTADSLDTMVIQGIRSESMNGIKHRGSGAVEANGYSMSMDAAHAERFADLATGRLILAGCSGSGTIIGSSGILYNRGGYFPSDAGTGTAFLPQHVGFTGTKYIS